MPVVKVENFHFSFQPRVLASKYDSWHYYKGIRGQCKKAVDVVAVEGLPTGAILWLIEAKDFRVVNLKFPPNPSNIGGLAETVVKKAEDTLQGLKKAKRRAAVLVEKKLAALAMKVSQKRLVLHLEPYAGNNSQISRLFPRMFSANILQKLKQTAKHIDLNPLVLNISNTPFAQVPWIVS